MEELLWTFEDVMRFLHHPDRPLRSWAVERLIKRFPDRAGDALLDAAGDADEYITLMAAQWLAETGDRARYGPPLLEWLKTAQDSRLGILAEALARLGHREVLPHILKRLAPAPMAIRTLDADGALRLVKVLGILGGQEARAALWEILEGLSPRGFYGGALMDAILEAAQPEDLPRLVRMYRSWPVGPYSDRELDAFASAAGAVRLAEEMEYAAKDGLQKALERAEWWLSGPLDLSESCLQDLASAFAHNHEGVFEVLLREAQRILDQRGDDLAGWHAAWEAGERPVGYRRQALFIPSILEAFGAQPNPQIERRMSETVMGLALVCQLGVDSDDQGRLDAAEDKTEAVLDILRQDRENVLPGIVDQVAALGQEIVPRLIASIDPHDTSWGLVRVVDALECLARRYPGSCDAAIPLLIETVNDEQGDFVLESCSRALEAIGPVAVEPIAERLGDDDTTRQIYLTGVMGEMPTERAAQAVLAAWEDSEVEDEGYVTALASIGSPSAIEPLYKLWRTDREMNRYVAQPLLVLCELNGVSRPELAEWRRTVEAHDARMLGALKGIQAVLEEGPLLGAGLGLGSPRGRHATPKSGGLSKKERRKRSAQRKRQRSGKKKHKR
jgi:hypothetical protein